MGTKMFTIYVRTDIFPVYGLETGKIPVSILYTGQIFDLHNVTKIELYFLKNIFVYVY